jgi:hypothetical protein
MFIDRPPAGWFTLDVMRTAWRKWDWVALMIDVPPDDYIARRVVIASSVWVRIPGKHRDRDAAWDALGNMITTRH